MTNFPFDFKLQRSTVDQKKNCYISIFKINAEWSLICLWSNQRNEPQFLEIRRNSTTRDTMVSGTFKLMRNQTCVLQRKFIQLIEAGIVSTLVELEYSSDYSYYSHTPSYSISGTLKVLADVFLTENTKGVNYESLLVLSSDFERLMDPRAIYLSDVNLKCGTLMFSVHKNILSARSPVFAAMLATEMRESRENIVDISDIGPDVLKAMLIYIYTGKTGALSVQSAGELLFAGDKYQLQDLKKVCSDYLKSCMSFENVLKTLVLGYLHDKELCVFAIHFICKSYEEFEVLEKTVDWNNLLREIPSLAMRVLTCLVKSKDVQLKRKK